MELEGEDDVKQSYRYLLALLLATSAHGQAVPPREIPPPPEPRQDGQAATFKELDQNGDGKLSPLEYARVPDPSLSFLELDRDADEKLSVEEYEVVRARARDPAAREENRENRQKPQDRVEIQLPAQAPPVTGR